MQWDDWSDEHQPRGESSYESRARRQILVQAVALTRAIEERELLLDDDRIAPDAQYQTLNVIDYLR